MDRGEDKFLLFGSGEDFVKIDWDSEGDEEETADTGTDPVRRLKRRWGYELGPERGASLSEKDGVFGGSI